LEGGDLFDVSLSSDTVGLESSPGKAAFPLVQLRMRRGNSMQEERHVQNGCARGRRKVTHVSRSQTGRYMRVFASFRLLVHVSF
jgi:hypothetical protein